jgi:hypothetical protein
MLWKYLATIGRRVLVSNAWRLNSHEAYICKKKFSSSCELLPQDPSFITISLLLLSITSVELAENDQDRQRHL